MQAIFRSASMTNLHFRFRRKAFPLMLTILFVAMQMAAMSPGALGAPAAGFKCTKKQMKKYQDSKDGKKCEAKATEDLINSSSTMHGIYCSSSGEVLCCERKDGKVVDGSCETVKEVRVPFKPRPEQKAITTGNIERVTQPRLLDGGPKGGILEPSRGPSATSPSPTGAPTASISSATHELSSLMSGTGHERPARGRKTAIRCRAVFCQSRRRREGRESRSPSS